MEQWVVVFQKRKGARWERANPEVFFSRQAAEKSMDGLQATLSDREKNQGWPHFKVEPIAPDVPSFSKPKLGRRKAAGESLGRGQKRSS